MCIFTDFEQSWERSYDPSADIYQYYDDAELGIDHSLEQCFESTRLKLGDPATLEESVATYARDKPYYYIQSVVGDDENTTTDLPILANCLIAFGEVISNIRVSWKDCGASEIISNYAEGWSITPPNREASFEATNRRHKGEAIPFVLDTVKMKNLSPVRKQSMLWELDLESKISSIAKVAAWTSKSWFTYDYHQMAYLLANSIFDFEDSVKFPYLHGSEGGCGGDPPYGNLDTVYSALHYYNRGRSKIGVLGLMKESYLINTGKMAPKESFFIKASHIAQMGSSEWLQYETAYRSLKATGEISSLEANDLLKSDSGTQLPEDILRFGIEVKPSSFLEGHSISILRDKGYILTELDVKVLLDAKTREQAIYGRKPFYQVLATIESEQKIFRSKFIKILSEIVSASPQIRSYLKEKLVEIPTGYTEELIDTLSQYYVLRSETYSQFSSFRYTDEIRIFKKHEVEGFLMDNRDELYKDMFMESRPVSVRRSLEENFTSNITYQEIDEWFNSAPMGELLRSPAPPGLGIDDYRIVTSTLDSLNRANLQPYEVVVLLVFTADKDLTRILYQIVSERIKPKVVVISISPQQYISLCAMSLYGLYSYDERKTSYYNYLTKKLENFPVSVLDQIIESSGLDRTYFEKALLHLEYDFPNVEKYLENYSINTRTRSLTGGTGGYLKLSTIRQMNAMEKSWAFTSYSTIKEWPDFRLSQTEDRIKSFRRLIVGREVYSNPFTPGLASRSNYRDRKVVIKMKDRSFILK